MDFKNILSFAHKKAVAPKESYYRPVFHWRMVVAIAGLIFISGGTLCAFLYFTVAKMSLPPLSSGGTSISRAEEKKVEDTLLFFRAKKEVSTALRENRPVYADPSVGTK